MNNEIGYYPENEQYFSDEIFSELFDESNFKNTGTHGNYADNSYRNATRFESTDPYYFELREALTNEFPEMHPEEIESLTEIAWGPIIGAVASAVPSIVQGVRGLFAKNPSSRIPPTTNRNPSPPPQNRPQPRPVSPNRTNPLNTFLNLLQDPRVMNGLLQLIQSRSTESIHEEYEGDYESKETYQYPDNYQDELNLA